MPGGCNHGRLTNGIQRSPGRHLPPQADQREIDAEGLEEFQKEVAEYVELRRRLDKKLAPLPPKPPPERVHAYQVGLEKLLAAKRARSREGNLFVRKVRPLLRRLIRERLTGPGGRALRAEIYDEAPGRTFRIVADIAEEVGYESEAAFNRAFKREFGSPPARYRRGPTSSENIALICLGANNRYEER